MIDGLGGDEQLGGDLGVAVTGADLLEPLTFAAGQSKWIRAGGGPEVINRAVSG